MFPPQQRKTSQQTRRHSLTSTCHTHTHYIPWVKGHERGKERKMRDVRQREGQREGRGEDGGLKHWGDSSSHITLHPQPDPLTPPLIPSLFIHPSPLLHEDQSCNGGNHFRKYRHTRRSSFCHGSVDVTDRGGKHKVHKGENSTYTSHTEEGEGVTANINTHRGELEEEETAGRTRHNWTKSQDDMRKQN